MKILVWAALALALGVLFVIIARGTFARVSRRRRHRRRLRERIDISASD